MAKRVFLADLRHFDLENDESITREIEMLIEIGLRDSAYSLQFWKDVSLYGLKEAVLYLKNQNRVTNLDEIEHFVTSILKKFDPKS